MARTKQQTPSEEIVYYLPEDVMQTEDHYLNRDSCYSQDNYVNQECHNCNHMMKCIYKNKYNYRKIG